MKTNMLTRARALFRSEYVSRSTNRANQLAWVRSIRLLGDKWILNNRISRVIA